MHIGDVELHILDLSPIYMDGGGVFGIIPRPMWQRLTPADDRSRIRLGLYCLLIRGADLCLLVETGLGSKREARFYDLYGGTGDERLLNLLAQHGVAPEAVTHVVFSHLHFLPAGGGTTRHQGKSVPTFPNAQYLVQRAEYEWAINPNEHTRGSYFDDDFAPLVEAGQLRLLDGATQVAPGIELIPTGGHTPGHQILSISAGPQRMVYLGHLIPTAWHLAPHYIMAYDSHPMETLARKKVLLEQAATQGWLLAFLNNPDRPTGYIRRADAGFTLETVEL